MSIDKSEYYTVGEFAKKTNVTAETLRYYHRINLLSPSFIDPETGYRYYSLSDVEKVGVIQSLQSLGVSLSEIDKHLRSKNIISSSDLLKKQYTKVCKDINVLLKTREYLEEKISAINRLITNPELDIIIKKHIKKRSGYSSTNPITSYVEQQKGIGRLIEQYNSNLFLGNSLGVVCYLSKSTIQYNSLVMDIDRPRNMSSQYHIFPEQDYLTLQFSGTFLDCAKHLKILRKYIKDNNLTINGEILMLSIVDEYYTDDTSEYITEIQVPID